VTERRSLLKRTIGGIYSAAADRIYEPVVVRFGFPLLGGNVNALALEQGKKAVATAAGEPILDMPVGTAYFTVRVAQQHGGLVVGSDIAEGMVRASRRAAGQAGVTNLEGVIADAHNLPFREGAFKAILCTNGLQVIPDLDRSLAELARVLSPEGTLYTSIIAVPLSRALPERTADHLPTMFKSRREVTRAFARAGLQVLSIASNRFALLLEAARRAR
jgi:ubiquinone/menaquinone biosynthesis C-methylase UbiE